MTRITTSKPVAGASQSFATIGFGDMALFASAVSARSNRLRSLCKAMGNLWIAAGKLRSYMNLAGHNKEVCA